MLVCTQALLDFYTCIYIYLYLYISIAISISILIPISRFLLLSSVKQCTVRCTIMQAKPNERVTKPDRGGVHGVQGVLAKVQR